MKDTFVKEQFTIKRSIRGHQVSKLFWTPAIGEMLFCEWEHKSTADLYTMRVISDLFTVVARVPQRPTSFQVAEHGYLTDHVNGIT